MPTDSINNMPLFTVYLSVLSSVVDNSDVQAVYILEDFNAHVNEPFNRVMIDFCSELQWTCADIDKNGVNSDTYAYISDVYGCRR